MCLHPRKLLCVCTQEERTFLTTKLWLTNEAVRFPTSLATFTLSFIRYKLVEISGKRPKFNNWLIYGLIIELEHGVTHTSDDRESSPVLLISKIEESHPSIDFSHSYRLSRLFGLTPDQNSFLFKLLKDVLPTREHLHRCGKVHLLACLFCDVQVDTVHISWAALRALLSCLLFVVRSIT